MVFIPYRSQLVKDLALELGALAAECRTKEQFSKESLTWMTMLFNRYDLEAKEYYRLCKIRAEMLEAYKWCGDGKK